MKCDELKRFDIVGKYRDEETVAEFRPDGECYDADEVDAAIAELKAIVTTDNSAVIARLEEQLRKTQRAMWHDRAIRAEHMKNLIFEGELIYHDDSGEELDWRIMYRKWERAETACRAKAKEYE